MPKKPKRGPGSKPDPTKTRVQKNFRRRAQRDRERLERAAEGHQPIDKIVGMLDRQSSAEQYLGQLRTLAEQGGQIRRQGRAGLRLALAHAYEALLKFNSLQKPARKEVLASLIEEQRKRGVGRTNQADPVRLLLRAMMDYSGLVVGQSQLTREAQAISYALAQEIPPAEFALRLGRKGETIQSWSKRWASQRKAQRDSSAPRSDLAAKQAAAEPASAPANAEALHVLIPTELLSRPGRYLATLRLKSDESVVIEECDFLTKKRLAPDRWGSIFREAQTLVPVTDPKG